jgi:dihydroflavonol-4-reductase
VSDYEKKGNVMARVLVTGANGHLGANTVRALLNHEHDVVAFVRPTSDLRGLAGLPISYKIGDVADADSVKAAADGCEVIIHTAGIFRFWISNQQKIIQTALDGARNIFLAAEKVGVRRIIYTSSTYAIGFSNDIDRPRTPYDWNDDPQTTYACAKTQSEKAAWHWAAATGIPMISLCPAGLWGPYDYRLTPAMRWIRDLVNGPSPVINTGGSFVDVRDAAEVHARAVKSGQPGCRYAIVGANLTMKQMSDIITKLTGVKHFYLNLAPPLMHSIAGLMEIAAKATGWDPLSTRAFIAESLDKWLVADGRETNDTFNILPRGDIEMIRDAIRWLIFVGAVNKRRAAQLCERFQPDPGWNLESIK